MEFVALMVEVFICAQVMKKFKSNGKLYILYTIDEELECKERYGHWIGGYEKYCALEESGDDLNDFVILEKDIDFIELRFEDIYPRYGCSSH